MFRFIFIVFIVIVLYIVLVVLLQFICQHYPTIGGTISKSEDYVRGILSSLTHSEFPQAHPTWLLNEAGAIMEIDGYNEELAIAFEYQGPQHTRYDARYDSDYESYLMRLKSDKCKREQIKARGIDLIIVDYQFPKLKIREYLISRLYDIALRRKQVPTQLTPFTVQPSNYIKEQIFEPYRR